MNKNKSNFRKSGDSKARKQAMADISESEIKNYIPEQSRIRDAAICFAGVFVSLSNL